MKKRIIALLLTLSLLLSILPISAFAAEGTATIKVDSVEASPGSTTTVNVTISNNPGILSATFTLAWDEGLTLVGAESGAAFAALDYTAPMQFKQNCKFIWAKTDINEGDIKNGTILTLTFEVNDNVAEGRKYGIYLSYIDGDIYDRDFNDVDATIENGGITAITYIPGDANGDKKVNTRDAITILRYYSDGCTTDPEGYNITLNPDASDVNDDGKINTRDAIMILRYYSDGCITDPEGYNIVLKPSMHKACTHVKQETAYNASTCTEDGNIAYWYCESCNKYYNSADGTTEVTLADTVIPATGHIEEIIPATDTMTEGKKCSVCHEILVEPQPLDEAGKVYSIQYMCEMVPSTNKNYYISSENVDQDSFRYIVGKEKALPHPQLDKYTFLGWTDKKGNFYKDTLPAGTTGDLILYANWVSDRNKAVPVSKLGSPYIMENTVDGTITFAYEIGKLVNVPLYTTLDLQCANGLITTIRQTKEKTITNEMATSIAETVSEATSESAMWTLSSDWNSTTKVDSAWATEHEMKQEDAETLAKSSTDTYGLVHSTGGSQMSTSSSSSTSNYSNNESHSRGFDKEHMESVDVTTDHNFSAEVGASMPLGPVSLNAKVGYSYDNEKVEKTYDDLKETGSDNWNQSLNLSNMSSNSKTSSKSWNTDESFSKSDSVSESKTIKTALSDKIIEETKYGESNSIGGTELSSDSTEKSVGKSNEASSTVKYYESAFEGTTREFSSTGNTHGNYRMVMAGTVHVFAVVTYDIASGTYVVSTLDILGTGSKNDAPSEYLDYSYDGTFDDYETSVLPFEVPYEVNQYVNARIAETRGFQYDLDEGKVSKYLDKGKNELVLVPSYKSADMNNGEREAVKISSISAELFAGDTTLKAVVLSEFITEIPEGAFEGCTSLQYVRCPGVTKIGKNAFKGCTSLAPFTVSENVTEIGEDAFLSVPEIKVNASSTAVAQAAANAGATSLTLNLATIPEEKIVPDIEFNVGAITKFELWGGDRAYPGLRVNSDATTTVLNGVKFTQCTKIPLELTSSFVTMERVSAENTGFALVLDADHTTLTLNRSNVLTSGGVNTAISKNVTLAAYSPNIVGTLSVSGKLLVFGTAEGTQYLTKGTVEHIDEDTFNNKDRLNAYKLHFDPNDGSCDVESMEATPGTPIGTLPTPTRQYYTFDGWYLADGTKVTATTAFSNGVDQKLIAHWTPVKYTLTFNASGGSCSETSRTLNYQQTVGTLPTPTRDYYTFDGWYTAASGGTKISASTVLTPPVNTTVYAHWTQKGTQWALASQVPSGAQTVQEEWRYTLRTNTESEATSLDGYTPYGSYWVKSAENSFNYASFPNGFDTGNWIYTSFHKSCDVSAYENSTSKREVSTAWAGYVYYKWDYNAAYANRTDRAVSPVKLNNGTGGFAFGYFHANLSQKDHPYLDKYYCNNYNMPSYNCSSEFNTTALAGPTPRFFRFDYYTCTYTDYYKMFQYYKTEKKTSSTAVTASSTISDVQHWVLYRAK